MKMKRCGRRVKEFVNALGQLYILNDYFGGQQNDPEACGKMAPYKVRERDIWLCDTHYADWLEHEWEVSHQ